MDNNSTTVSFTDTKNFQNVFEYFRIHLQIKKISFGLRGHPPYGIGGQEGSQTA
jgi:hypothetical protein